MEVNTKKVVQAILILMCLIGILVVWKFFSAQVGIAAAGVLSLFGFGGKGAVRKVKRHAKRKAKQVSDAGPDAVTADINKHLDSLGR